MKAARRPRALQATVAAVLLCSVASLSSAPSSLDQYDVLVSGTLQASDTDARGRIAVGSNLIGVNWAAGAGISSNGNAATVLVGNNVTIENGAVYNGSLVYGGTANITNVQVPDGNIIRVPNCAEVVSRLSQDVQTFSKALAAANPTPGGRFQFIANQVIFTPDSTQALNIVQLPLEALNPQSVLVVNASQPEYAGSGKSVSVAFNVLGQHPRFSGFAMSLAGDLTEANIMFNMPEAEFVTVNAIEFRGTLIAPFSHLNFYNARLYGSIFVSSLIGDGEEHPIPPMTPECFPLVCPS